MILPRIICICTIVLLVTHNVASECKDECASNERENVDKSNDCDFVDGYFQVYCEPKGGAGENNNGGDSGSAGAGSTPSGDSNSGTSGDPGTTQVPDIVFETCSAEHGQPCTDGLQFQSTCTVPDCDTADPNSECLSYDCKDNPPAPPAGLDPNNNAFNQQQLGDTINTARNNDAQKRSFGLSNILGTSLDEYGRPLPGLCKLPKPFPMNCPVPKRTEPYGEMPPVDIPYCQRIPCNAQNNGPYDQSKRLCHSQPGCYFDYELYKYREWIPTIYPGVPVCHMAIRNKVFLEKTQLVPRWSSYFTNCLINNFQEEIFKQSLGCAMLPMLRAFNVHPKMAGWRDIQQNECKWIGACWDNGCYYEVNINAFMVKSRQYASQNRGSIDQMIPYGRAKCQNFDTTNPSTILKSMHICLASGCTVDPRVWIQYHDLFYDVGRQYPLHVHAAFNNGINDGTVGLDNYEAMLQAYSNTRPPAPQDDPNMSAFPFSNAPSGADCLIGNQLCPPKLYRKYGLPGKYRFPKTCPYKQAAYPLPGVGFLKGSFAGCCDGPHLCYFPKKELAFVNSGQSVYYGEWSAFSTCTKSCNGGTQIRRRKCIATDAGKCDKGLSETRSCNMEPCPSWGLWGAYGSCSRECGTGQQTRYRQCLPSLDPVNCFGSSSENRQCNKHPCVNRFGNWGGWEGSCEPCGTTMVRRRSCALFQNCLESELVDIRQCDVRCGSCAYQNVGYGGCVSIPGKGCVRFRQGQCVGGATCKDSCKQYRKCAPKNCMSTG